MTRHRAEPVRAPRVRPGAGHARALRLLRELALTAGALAGVLCVVLALLGATVGIQPLVFTSGSMAPTIDTGDLAVTRPVEPADVAVGDVVSVHDGRGERVTHRVVEVDAARRLLRLQGDANDTADPLPYPADRVDRVLFTVPAGGYLLRWLSGPTAGLLLGAYLVLLLRVLWPRAVRPTVHGRPGPHAARHRTRTTVGALAVLAGLAGLAAGGAPVPEPTLAAWTDAVPVGGGPLSAYRVPKPVITGCSVALLTVPITWTAVSSPYPLTYRAVVVETAVELPVTGTGGTRTAIYPTVLQAVPGLEHTVRITAALPSGSPWTSVAAEQGIALPSLGTAPSCGPTG